MAKPHKKNVFIGVAIATTRKMAWYNVPTPIQIRLGTRYSFHPGTMLWTPNHVSLELYDDMIRLRLLKEAKKPVPSPFILVLVERMLRTGTASPSCSRDRPGAQPWLCSWEEGHIAIPENGNPPSVWLHRAKLMASKFQRVLSVTGKLTWMSAAGAGQWVWIISFDTNPTPPSQTSGGCTETMPI